MSRIAVALLALLLTGCVVSREALVLRDVPLDPDAVPTALVPLPLQLQVEAPRAAEPLGDVRIAVRDAGDRYAVLPRVRWREPTPRLVQSLLVQAFEHCRCLAGVARDTGLMRADYVLTGELRELAIADDGPGPAVAVARLSLTLVHARSGRVLAATQREHSTPLATRSDAAGITALAAALNAVVAETVVWLHDTLQSDPNKEESP